MDKKDKLKSYMVQANLKLMVGVEVTAKNLEEAMAKAKELKDDDFVEILGEYQDGSMNVTGLYECDPR